MNIIPFTKLYAVLGHPVAHSLSPRMQNAALRKLGLDAVYLAFDVEPARLLDTLKMMGDLGFAGVNLTVPLKEVAFKELRDIDSSARKFGSINTIKFKRGGMKGYSTDGAGFLAALKLAFNCSPAGLSVFLLGCGGAGRAVGLVCAGAGAAKISLADSDQARARKLQKDITILRARTGVEIVAPDRLARNQAARAAQLVIQATPIGMQRGDRPLLDAAAFTRTQMVYDLIYMFPRTRFLKIAAKQGARVANGLDMLLFQGALSLSIWTGLPAPLGVMRKELEQAVYGKKRSRSMT